jgi:murein DD-endopeptidase MepM/ murein hydrolase activator NlpD
MTRYGHNSRNLVRVGQSVQKGDPVAIIGSTGRSTGTHVHFEVLKDGTVVNPRKYLSE